MPNGRTVQHRFTANRVAIRFWRRLFYLFHLRREIESPKRSVVFQCFSFWLLCFVFVGRLKVGMCVLLYILALAPKYLFSLVFVGWFEVGNWELYLQHKSTRRIRCTYGYSTDVQTGKNKIKLRVPQSRCSLLYFVVRSVTWIFCCWPGFPFLQSIVMAFFAGVVALRLAPVGRGVAHLQTHKNSIYLAATWYILKK